MFLDRKDAGRQLATMLEEFRGQDVVIVGLPRGGVPVAAEVARVLGAPLDIIGVRKLGVPGQEELAMGAIGEGGVSVRNEALVRSIGISDEEIHRVRSEQEKVLQDRLEVFRSGRPEVSLAGKVVIIVDDGLATGATARVACRVARARGAATVVLAVPVAPVEEAQSFADADQLVVVSTPEPFFGVGAHYANFEQTTTEEVVDALGNARS